MTDQDRLVFIFQDDIARRRELVRISEVAIGLHEDRIAGHRAIVAAETAEIERLERAVAENYELRNHRGDRNGGLTRQMRDQAYA